MQFPLQITFRGIEQSDAIEATIRRRAERLERFAPRIIRCHVIVDQPHRHHNNGNHYAVHIDLSTPKGNVAITRDPPLDGSHENFQAVVRDAFDAAVRHLEPHARWQRAS